MDAMFRKRICYTEASGSFMEASKLIIRKGRMQSRRGGTTKRARLSVAACFASTAVEWEPSRRFWARHLCNIPCAFDCGNSSHIFSLLCVAFMVTFSFCDF
jgi:hypothetical protein